MSSSWATETTRNYNGQVVYPFCMVKAANYIRIDPDILLSIYKIEGGKTGLVSINRNRTFDMGPMQVNSSWLHRFNPRLGITKSKLINDGCVNVMASAIILRYYINRAHSVWRGVGNYHSHTLKYHNRYRGKVWRTYKRIKASHYKGLYARNN